MPPAMPGAWTAFLPAAWSGCRRIAAQNFTNRYQIVNTLCPMIGKLGTVC